MKLTGDQIVKATGHWKFKAWRYWFGDRPSMFTVVAALKRQGWVPIEVDLKHLTAQVVKPWNTQ